MLHLIDLLNKTPLNRDSLSGVTRGPGGPQEQNMGQRKDMGFVVLKLNISAKLNVKWL